MSAMPNGFDIARWNARSTLTLSRRSLAKTDGRRARFAQRNGYNPKREHDVQGRRRVDGKPEG